MGELWNTAMENFNLFGGDGDFLKNSLSEFMRVFSALSVKFITEKSFYFAQFYEVLKENRRLWWLYFQKILIDWFIENFWLLILDLIKFSLKIIFLYSLIMEVFQS